ncbi:MAG: 4-hydroxythreonine-4-phosphate dehydrogenase PdxA [Phycisphaerales bacterium]
MAVPLIAISLGDPGGIGPEVVLKALADPALRARARWLLIGPESALRAAAAHAAIAPFWQRHAAPPRQSPANISIAHSGNAPTMPSHAGDAAIWDIPCARADARPTPEGGEVSFLAVEIAIALALLPRGDPRRAHAIVTAPINKEAWSLAGHGEFAGHTELLAARCSPAGSAPPAHAMMFVTPRLRVVLATTHIPLAAVPAAITTDRVLSAIRVGAAMCARLGLVRPRVAVCGLNPHAGENGLLGTDETRAIVPAIAAARSLGIDARGPMPGDTVFNAAVIGDYDLVVAMYHDQGLIPVKLLDRDRAVNTTAGLPIVRTSPDHGTAYDIAGSNRADPGSTTAAIELAARLATDAA